MSGVNKMILVGNLGVDPTSKDVNGQTVCNFTLATNEQWKDKAGQKQERVEWTNIVVWGKRGEACAKYLTKGSNVYIEGRKQTREYTDKDGVKRYWTECVANDVQFLGDGKRQHQDEEPPPGEGYHAGGPSDDLPF